MTKMSLATAALCAVGAFTLAAPSFSAPAGQKSTVAVFGDFPYSTALLARFPALNASVNADPDVKLVIHVGDIHSGSMPCTGAGLNPLPAGSVPTWNQGVYYGFQQFDDPVVYTPGDNEWTDCHKKKQLRSGAPLNELGAVRSLFFPRPGYTLGKRSKEVESQALEYEVASDAQFVENVMWNQSRVVFVTLNVPGSNDDGLPWNGTDGNLTFLDETARLQEVAARDAANLRWLKEAFRVATARKAVGVVITLQADMWDLTALAAGGDGLNGYDALVQEIARQCAAFNGQVLLLNGDTHLYGADRPLADPNSATFLVHGTGVVTNLTRITVQGSTNTPNEWVKLTIDPSSPQVFSWVNVAY